MRCQIVQVLAPIVYFSWVLHDAIKVGQFLLAVVWGWWEGGEIPLGVRRRGLWALKVARGASRAAWRVAVETLGLEGFISSTFDTNKWYFCPCPGG